MYYGAPVPVPRVFHGQARGFQPTLIDEINGAVRPRAPDMRRNSVDDEPEAIFALLQGRVEILQASGGIVEHPPEVGKFIIPCYGYLMLKFPAR